MAKEVLIYGGIDSESSTEFFECVNECQDEYPDEEIKFRVNTEGGEPAYGWGMIAKIQEVAKKSIHVDGQAYSFGAFALCYVEESSCLDVSQFLFHRAAYSEWFEKSEYFTEPMKQNLKSINASLEKALRNKIDVKVFEDLGKGTIKEIFSMDSRLDVVLNAKEARAIGLVKEVIKITPKIKAEIDTKLSKVTARLGLKIAAKQADINFEEKVEPKKIKTMTSEELKAQFPTVYASIFQAGKEEGVNEENDRVSAAMVFAHLDVEEVKKVVASKKPMTATQIAEFALKAMSPEKIAAIKKDAPVATITDPEKDAKTELAQFEEQIRAQAGLKPKTENFVIGGQRRFALVQEKK